MKKTWAYMTIEERENLVDRWNRFCEENCLDDSYIYRMEELDNLADIFTPLELASRCWQTLNPRHEYFVDNGNFQSFQDPFYGYVAYGQNIPVIDMEELEEWEKAARL